MNHKLMFTKDKIKKLEEFLKGFRYYNEFSDFDIYFSKGEDYSRNKMEKINLNHPWGEYDGYYWMELDIKLPEDMKSHDNLGFFHFGTGDSNVGFESLCILNGKEYQGVDNNHKEVFLPKGLTEFNMKFKLWGGVNAGNIDGYDLLGHKIKECRFLSLDKECDDYYHLLKAMIQTLDTVSEKEKMYHDLLAILNKSFKMICMTDPKEKIRGDIKGAHETLKDGLKGIESFNNIITRCIGHTHIDVAWLWRIKHTREKALRSFSTVMRLMERYPDYIFIQSQPQLYQYIKEDCPELYEEIKKRIKEGKWEANGGMWVEADCNLTSGESLVRQLLYGKKFFEEEFDAKSNCLWLPDVFGYSGALPQILKKSDIDTFMTTKISWNQHNRIPNDTFNWKGIDGSKILTHFITTPDGWGSNYYTYNGFINAGTVNGIWEQYKNKDLTDELLVSYGWGDGGGGVDREMLEMREKLDMIPSNPKVETGKAGEYFDRLHENVKDKELNVWDGELYLEFHRGTYTSQANTKKYNRKLEFAFRNNEILSTRALDTLAYPHKLYDTEWKKLLTNQFHDILPGSSITEVYEDCEKEYAEIEESLNNNLDRTIKKLVNDNEEDYFTVYNFNNFERTEIVKIPRDGGMKFRNSKGEELKAQKENDFYYVNVTLKPLAFTNIQMEKIVDNVKSMSRDINFIENEQISITWNTNGKITSIFDKKNNIETLEEGNLGNDIAIFEDLPRMFDAWELEPYYEEKKFSVDNLISSKLIEDGSLIKKVEFVWEFNKSKIIQNMILSKDSKRVDFETKVDWQERDRILRTYFPLNVRATKATYDIQFGNLERPTHSNTEWDYSKFEVSAHKWGDISERGLGVALLNDCKYGYNAKDNILGLSLLKSASAPAQLADKGEHEFTYSYLPHCGDWYEGNVEIEAHSLNNPPQVFKGKAIDETSIIEINAKNIVVDALKESEDGNGIIVRFHEYGGMKANVEVKTQFNSKWCETNLMERELEEVKNEKISIEIAPYEIKTIKIFK